MFPCQRPVITHLSFYCFFVEIHTFLAIISLMHFFAVVFFFTVWAFNAKQLSIAVRHLFQIMVINTHSLRRMYYVNEHEINCLSLNQTFLASHASIWSSLFLTSAFFTMKSRQRHHMRKEKGHVLTSWTRRPITSEQMEGQTCVGNAVRIEGQGDFHREGRTH